MTNNLASMRLGGGDARPQSAAPIAVFRRDVLEPAACATLVQHYVVWRYELTLPLLRIYVDLERIARGGQLVRYNRPRLGGEGTTFSWETSGLVLVELEPPPLEMLTAAAPVTRSISKPLEAILAGSGFDIAQLKSWQARL
jgi:hypothetical protein